MAEQFPINELTDFGFAAIMARKGAHPEAIGQRLGRTVPAQSGWAGDAALALIGTGPGTWLAQLASPDPYFVEDLTSRLKGLASVSDVSGSYRVFQISGPCAETILRRGAFVDFASPAFGEGSVAVTVIAHIGVVIRQLDAAPTYEIAAFRSFSESLLHWLTTAAATL